MNGRPARWKTAAVLALHAFAVWILCGATIGVGRALLPVQTTLVVHAVLAPVFAAVAAWIYASRFGYTSPLATATFFLAFIMLMDFFLVALVLERSLDMFRSALGTWIPFAEIFVAALAAGTLARRRPAAATAPTPPAGPLG